MATLGCAYSGSDGDDTSHDASRPADAAIDATTVDAGCAISQGLTPALDGTNDLAEYPSAQRLSLAAMLGSDAAAIAWNPSHLFITVSSTAFTAPYEPLHVYLEAGTVLGPAHWSMGKTYSGLTPALPFTSTHLIAVRRISDSGTGGYNGVYGASDGWRARTASLDAIVSADQRTLSVAVPWSAITPCPTTLRLAMHVVHGEVQNEWKDLVPTTHTPWLAPGGGYYEIDLTTSPAVARWTMF